MEGTSAKLTSPILESSAQGLNCTNTHIFFFSKLYLKSMHRLFLILDFRFYIIFTWFPTLNTLIMSSLASEHLLLTPQGCSSKSHYWFTVGGSVNTLLISPWCVVWHCCSVHLLLSHHSSALSGELGWLWPLCLKETLSLVFVLWNFSRYFLKWTSVMEMD